MLTLLGYQISSSFYYWGKYSWKFGYFRRGDSSNGFTLGEIIPNALGLRYKRRDGYSTI